VEQGDPLQGGGFDLLQDRAGPIPSCRGIAAIDLSDRLDQPDRGLTEAGAPNVLLRQGLPLIAHASPEEGGVWRLERP
jgi:hypothetical protein